MRYTHYAYIKLYILNANNKVTARDIRVSTFALRGEIAQMQCKMISHRNRYISQFTEKSTTSG